MSNYLFINQDKSAEMLVPLIPVDYNLQAQNDRLIYVPLATRNNFGIVKIGEGLKIEHGLVSFDRKELDVKLSTNVGSEFRDKLLSVSDNGDIIFIDKPPLVTKLSELENDTKYITNGVSDLINYYTIDDVNRKFVKLEDLPNLDDYDLSLYAKKEEIPDVSNLASKDEIPDISNLATKDEIPNLDDFDLSEYAKKTDIPIKISELTNDTGFIKSTVDNLANYYLKTQLYTKDEVNTIVNNIKSFNVEIVTVLPTTNISTTTFYLIKKDTTEGSDYYDEYLYINNAFELIGNTKIDLSNYYTKDESNNLFAKQSDLTTTNINVNSNAENISSLITSLSQTQTTVSEISKKVDKRYTKTEVDSLISGFITKDVNNLTNYDTSATILAREYVTATELNAKGYATSTDITNINKDLTEARNDIADLEEAIRNMDNSAEFADRVTTLEENYTLLNDAFNEVAGNHDDRLYAIEDDYLTYQDGLDLPFVDYSTDQSIYSIKQFTKGLKLSTGTFVMTADGRAIVGFNSSGYVSVGNGSTQLVMNSSGRPRIYSDANNYEEVAYLSDTPEIDTSNLVDLTTAQTIGGNKTFSGTVIVPDVTIS